MLIALFAVVNARATPESVVVLAPGAPAQRVIARIGATPQVTAKFDAAETAFKPAPALVALGRKLFADKRLSEPAGVSCAGCHDPARAFSPSLSAAAKAGAGLPQGSRAAHFSTRNAPSLLYVRYVPRRHFYQDEDAPLASPFGGLMADGRADTLAEQVRGPLLDPNEMNNGTPQRLLKKLRRIGVAQQLSAQFGTAASTQPEALMRALGETFQAYLQSDEMAPFSSRFDAYLRNKVPMNAAEMRGLALFKNPDKGNCASCHALSDTASRPERSLFTDFGYDAIAVPRNQAIPANRDPHHFDQGLCQTARLLNWNKPEQWCAYLRTPGLRNVAVRQSFMHNGVFRSLRKVVEFYNKRSLEPSKWYRGKAGFDDVAAEFQGNVNINSPPMNRRVGLPAALADSEIDDLVEFLRSLTDAAYVKAMP